MTRRSRKKTVTEEVTPVVLKKEFEFEWVETRNYVCNYVLSATSEEEARQLLVKHLAILDKDIVDYVEGDKDKNLEYESQYFEHFKAQIASSEPELINTWEV